jgi:hypothetical protein
MKSNLHLLYLSAGQLESGDFYASVQVLNNDVEAFDDGTRIGLGCKVAKIKVLTDNRNELSKRMQNSLTFPCQVVCTLKTAVKGTEMVMTITGFDSPTGSVTSPKVNESVTKTI